MVKVNGCDTGLLLAHTDAEFYNTGAPEELNNIISVSDDCIGSLSRKST